MTLSRPRRRTALVGIALIAFVALLAGFLAATPQVTEVVYAAACQADNGNCLGNPPYDRTAAVDVTYIVPGGAYSTPVEPSGDTDWTITAYWNTTGYVPCYEYYDTATVTVSWSGTSWTLSDETLGTYITDIDLCGEDTCDEVDTHSYGYRLAAELTDPVTTGGRTYNLRQVVFSTTAVSAGYELDTASCTLGDAVTAASQSFSAADNGTFECQFSCDNSGTSLNITYE